MTASLALTQRPDGRRARLPAPSIELGQCVLVALVLAGSIWPSDQAQAAAAGVVAIVVLLRTRGIGRMPITTILILAALGIIGVIGMIDSSWSTSDIVRDTANLLRLAGLLVLGLTVGLKHYGAAFLARAIVMAGAVDAIHHLVAIALDPSFLSTGLHLIRSSFDKQSVVEIVALALVIFWRRIAPTSKPVDSLWRWALGITLAGSIGLYFSRTSIFGFALVIAVVAILSFRRGRRHERRAGRARWVFAIIGLGAGIAGFSLVLSTPLQAVDDFLERASTSFDELVPSDANSLQEIKDNYRAYENYRALTMISNGTPLQYITGHGWGSAVDLVIDTSSTTHESSRVDAPKLHNGYLQILVKTGALGFLAYFSILIIGLRAAWRAGTLSGANRLLGDITLGVTVLTVLAGAVNGGLISWSSYNVSAVLIGLSVALVSDRGQRSATAQT